MRTLPLAASLLITVIALASPSPAHAQGNGRPKGPKAGGTSTSGTNTSATTTTTVAPTLSTGSTTYPQFGAWLDDASAPTKGAGSVSIGAGHWRLAGMNQTNVPMLGAGVGMTDRLQVSASVPFYRVNGTGYSASGLDDVYLSAKYTLVDPTLTVSEVGVAFSPVMEVLSNGAIDGRVHFALPVSIEIRRLPFRVYGSGGYFTRGAVFGGAALEWTAPAGVSFTGSLMSSYSIKTPDATLSTLGRQHVDVSGGIAAPVSHSATVYGNVGRSLTNIDEGGASLAVTGGVAIHFRAASSTP